MKNILFIAFTAFLLFTVSISFAPETRAQSAAVPVNGNPPLAENDFEGVVKFYERGLAIKFSENQLAEFKRKFSHSWRKAQKSNSRDLSKFLETVNQINSWNDAKIEKLQQELTESLLADLKTMTHSEWAAFVLSVYEDSQNAGASIAAGQRDDKDSAGVSQRRDDERTETQSRANDSPTPDTDDYRSVTGGVTLADLAGKWSKTSVSAGGYRNTVTGDYKSGYGFSNQHEIQADGGFDYYNFATISFYDCTTELFTKMKGRAVLNGSQITFNYASGTVNIKDSCKKSNVTKPAQIERATFRIERGRKYVRLCDVSSKESYCLYKTEE